MRHTSAILSGLLSAIWLLGGAPGCKKKSGTEDAFPGACRIESDREIDGDIDGMTTNTYDAAGNLLRVEEDTDLDGTPDRVVVHTYDADGNQVRTETDEDGDGVTDSITSREFAADGTLLVAAYDHDGDGVSEAVYRYNEAGDMVELGFDTDVDGVTDRGRKFTYDSAGALIRDAWWDNFNDAEPTSRSNYFYDGAGYLIRVDNERNFTPNVWTVVRTTNHTWNGDHTTRLSETLDGTVVSWLIYTEFDGDGVVVLEEVDKDADGTLDSRMVWDGSQRVTENDHDDDGTFDSRLIESYVDGRQISSELDDPIGGALEEWSLWTYDGELLATLEVHDASDARLDTYYYDCF